MKEVRIRPMVDVTQCSGCGTCLHVCPTMAYSQPKIRPIERYMLPPCNNACPAGSDVEGFVSLIQQDRWVEAYRLLKESNPLPGVTGRVCYAFCQRGCNRARFDQAVSIRALERTLSDHSVGVFPDVSACHHERVAVIGSGPCGLSCAYQLIKKGFQVTVFEQRSQIGGFLRYGIPDYKLPKSILDRELEGLQRLGLEFQVNQKVRNNLLQNVMDAYDAVYLALGFQEQLPFSLSGEDSPQVMTGLDFLTLLNSGQAPEMGGRILIFGGGHTAVDSARSVLRLGGRPTLIFEGEERDVRAHRGELEELKDEGIEIVTLTSPLGLIFEQGRLIEVSCQRMELAPAIEGGERRFVPVPGFEFYLSADTIINALGESGDLVGLPSMLKIEAGKIVVDRWGRTSMLKVFAGGDVTSGRGTVAHAIGSGRRGAQAILSYLLGESDLREPSGKAVVSATKMNFDYCNQVPGLASPRLSPEVAVTGFEEIYQTPSKEAAALEAERCLHCGVVPDFHPEYCLGCANCSSRCPNYAISIRKLEISHVVKVDVEEGIAEQVRQICMRAGFHPEFIVCVCTGTRAAEVAAAILKGAKTPEEISRATGARTGCTTCIEPILCLIKGAGLELGTSRLSDVWYPAITTIWEVPQFVIDKFQDRGFRFEDDKVFYKKLVSGI